MTRTENTRPKPLTLVLTANGKTGRRVAARLEAEGVPVRRGSRTGSPAFDWDDSSTWPAALAGVGAVYVVHPTDLAAPRALADVRAFTRMARDAGVKRLVLLSGRGEDGAQASERVVQQSGLEWTVVRASWFDQNFSEGPFFDLVMSGTVALPVSAVREPFVDVDDIADVAVAALTKDGHAGEVYEVTGPRLMTFAEATAEIARATGREVSFETISKEEFVAGLKQAGLPGEYVELLEYLFTEVLDGRNESLACGVQRALGRSPRDFVHYARDAAASGAWTRTESADEGARPETTSNEATLRLFIEEVVNRGNDALLHELIHPEYVYRGPGEEVRGREGLEGILGAYRGAFPDLHVEIEDVFSAGNRVAIRFTMTGTHDGTLMGVPATGRSIEVQGTLMSRLVDGKIVEEWELLDQMTLLSQIGVVSLPA